MSAALRRHGALYMADPLYRVAWLVGPLMAAIFVTSRLMHPAPADTPATVGAASVDPASPSALNVASIPTLYRDAKTGDRQAEYQLRQRANAGSASAQSAMGDLYDPFQNKASANASRTIEAIEWYRLAAKQGAPTAQRNLGVLLSRTMFGIPPNETEARRWFDAIAPIDTAAALQLAWLVFNGRGGGTDVAAAYRLLRMAADRGEVTADTWLGTIYETGSDKIAKNPVEAVRLFRLAALQGNVLAERELATHLETGDGAPADAAAARRWYALAAAGGDSKAQTRLMQIDPAAQMKSPEWGPVTRPIDIAAEQDVPAERERCIAFRVRDDPGKMAATLPSSFDQQKQKSDLLLPLTPRDPRVRYARAAALYDADKDDLARVHLECAIDDPVTLARYPGTAPYILALLARIDVDQNDRVDAEKTIAPVCISTIPGVRKLDDDIGLCR